ncbi:VCBS repeat-containing protein [Tellurirhabdus bombi]|uniref:VCBS repeat-containing protein n=1 Tax=Tellurirhabdus bombi TaxID=2907205 RepID=UPI001F181F56|nr:VCBS repeat-containing protein [Tellurirhabdus bombi]
MILRRSLCFLTVAFVSWLISSCQFSRQSLFSLLPADETGITFSNRVTSNDTMSILNFEYMYNGGGVALGDFNNDGLEDIFFSGNQVANKLYLNKGNFKFEDITEKAAVGGSGKWCSGVMLVDINNDGWMDIYVAATVSRNAAMRENLLYVNQGASNGAAPVFKEMAKEYGIADDSHTTCAAFFDYDKDGDLDLYVVTNTIELYPNAYRPKVNDGSSPTTDRLYRNDFDAKLGHPVFTNVSRQAHILEEGYGLGINITDINRDGWPDVYVTNDYLSDDLLYINNQDGTFTNKASQTFKHTSNTAMGNDISDINNDGMMDVVVLDMLPQDNYRKKMFLAPNSYQTYLNNDEFGYNHQYVRNTLQLNQGFQPGTRQPIFSDISLLADVAETDWSWTPMVVDFDHDGHRDIIVTNGYPKDIIDRDFMQFRASTSSVATQEYILSQIPEVKISNYAFKNNGDLTFKDATSDWGLRSPSFSNGAAYGDLDNDGDLDYVVNNINDSAFVYRNNLIEQKKPDANFLRVKFKGSDQNSMGLGAWVELRYGSGKKQVYEHTIYRGYLSTVENMAHFGLGTEATIAEMRVTWPNGKAQTLRNIKANQVLTVDIRQATEAATFPTTPSGQFFREVTDSLKFNLVHQEPEYIDFNQQKLLPHKLSQYAPAISVGDINGDGLDDMVMGGSQQNATMLLLQSSSGTFQQKPIDNRGLDKQEEDMGTLLFDADGDGDLDLYVASGGSEGNANTDVFQDRLYTNDGKGNFTLVANALPQNFTSKSCVKATDFDHDGDLDLFVGGRVVPNQYPRPVSSFILRNDSKAGQAKFTDVTATVANGLLNLGLVCDALWTDVDNDGWQDLMLAGEWMPITLLRNEKGKFTAPTPVSLGSSATPLSGWWNSLIAADFDQDGDMDYIAGNFGRNSLNRASEKQPISVYAKDFDNNGFYDAIPTAYFPDERGIRREYPFHGREDVIKQMISMRGRFPYFKDFAMAPMEKLLKEEELKDAIVLKTNYLNSTYLENKGTDSNGVPQFELHDLPTEAQLAPIFGMLADDFDKDGHIDLLAVGNDFSNETFTGRMDALNGLLLRGNGKGGFAALLPSESGFFVPGNAKGLARLTSADGSPLIVATQNRGPAKLFRCPKAAYTFRLQPTDAAALVTYAGSKGAPDRKQRLEFGYGESFLSQSGRNVTLGPDVKSVEVINYKGQKRLIPLKALASN